MNFPYWMDTDQLYHLPPTNQYFLTFYIREVIVMTNILKLKKKTRYIDDYGSGDRTKTIYIKNMMQKICMHKEVKYMIQKII